MKQLVPRAVLLATALIYGSLARADESPADDSAYAIRGQCIDHAENAPLANVRVRLARFAGRTAPAEIIAETVTNGDGRYEFLDLEPPRPDERLDRLEYALFAQAEGGPINIGGLGAAMPARLDAFNIRIVRGKVTLKGRVIDAAGRPIVGATVAQFTHGGRAIPGILSATTDTNGVYAIEDVGTTPGGQEFHYSVTVTHPEHPAIRANSSQAEPIHVPLPTGCTVVGKVVGNADNGPVSGALVTLWRIRQSDQVVAVGNGSVTLVETGGENIVQTDADGRFRIVVAEGPYNLTAETADRICVARTQEEFVAGRPVDLPPFKMIEGGYILGRVTNPATGEPVAQTSDGQPIAIGLIGPSHPTENGVISPTTSATVDENGRFFLRAAPGDNFPYFVNTHGDRMAWDTRNKPAVVVRAGETTACAMTINLPDDPAARLQAAAKLIAALPADPAQRVDRILEEFRRLNHTVDETELWCTLMRELVDQGGRDAVPRLIAELDGATENQMLRRLAFALRAIGDPRAVPALICAIPRTLQPSSSDYGLIVADADLAAFMQQHDLRDGRGGQYFNFGRPVREVFGALHALAGQDFADAEIHSISRSDDPRRAALQGQLYHRQAQRWQIWWDAHSREFTDDPAFQTVNLTPLDDPLAPPAADLRPGARFDGSGYGDAVLSPAEQGGQYAWHFLDLDTGFRPLWPDHIAQDELQFDFEALAAWAKANGVDLMCVTHREADGSTAFVLRGFGLQAVEITAAERRNLDRSLAAGMLPAGRPVGDLLLHFDGERPVADANGAFLYVTSEGNRGLIETTDRVTRTADLAGLAGRAPRGVGFHKGVRFNWKPIAPK